MQRFFDIFGTFWGAFAVGFVVSEFFGDYLKGLAKKAAYSVWDVVRHAVVELYQTVKNKL